MLGNTLRLIRIGKNMTMPTVALETGLQQSAISNIELGNKKPNFEELVKLSNVYQMSIDQVISFALLQNSLKTSDKQILEDIKRYYACSKDETPAKQLVR